MFVRAWSSAPALAKLAAALVLLASAAGCLGAPKLEDRWTRIDMKGANLAAGQTVSSGSTLPV